MLTCAILQVKSFQDILDAESIQDTLAVRCLGYIQDARSVKVKADTKSFRHVLHAKPLLDTQGARFFQASWIHRTRGSSRLYNARRISRLYKTLSVSRIDWARSFSRIYKTGNSSMIH